MNKQLINCWLWRGKPLLPNLIQKFGKETCLNDIYIYICWLFNGDIDTWGAILPTKNSRPFGQNWPNSSPFEKEYAFHKWSYICAFKSAHQELARNVSPKHWWILVKLQTYFWQTRIKWQRELEPWAVAVRINVFKWYKATHLELLYLDYFLGL